MTIVITQTELEAVKWAGVVLGLSGFHQALKHFFTNKLSDKAQMSITSALSVITVGLNDFLSQHKVAVGTGVHQSVTLLGGLTLAYRYAVAPAYGWLIANQSNKSNSSTDTSTSTTAAQPAAASSTEASF